MLITKPGRPSDSLFRCAKIEKLLAKQGFTGIKLGAYWVHWVELDQPLSHDDSLKLDQLLDYGEGHVFDESLSVLLVIAPRVGTLSPWSSKATAAATRLHLPIRRIERGKVFEIIRYSFSKTLLDIFLFHVFLFLFHLLLAFELLLRKLSNPLHHWDVMLSKNSKSF